MVLSRASSLRSAFRRSPSGAAGLKSRAASTSKLAGEPMPASMALRKLAAIFLGNSKASLQLIGSVAVTLPSAYWLWQQGPKKGEGHGHGDHEEHDGGSEEESKDESGEEGEDKPKEDGGEEQKDDGGDEDKKEEGDDDKSKSADKAKGEDAKGESEDYGSEDGDDKGKDTPPTSDDEEGEDKPGPNAPQQINKPSGGKGPGETSKGARSSTEKKGEKDSQGDHAGAKNPYIDDPEKSKKGEGVTETAKIHGTVDSNRDKR